MDINQVSRDSMRRIITGEFSATFESLSIKLFLVRANLAAKRDPSMVESLMKELREIISQNMAQPSVQKDLQLMMSA